MRPRALLRSAHLWAGLVLSLLLLVLGATGSVLVLKQPYWRLVYPELRRETAHLGPADHAGAIRAAREHFGDALRSVKLPQPGVGAYHLYLTDGEAFMSVGDHRVIDRWRPRERPMALVFDLHAHLMAGHTGERVGGVVGVLGVFLVLTGVYLWWPARRRFNLRTLLPTGFSRSKLLPGHRDLGVLATPILLILLLTGSGMVFYGTAGALLNGVLSDRAPTPEGPPEAVVIDAAGGTAAPTASITLTSAASAASAVAARGDRAVGATADAIRTARDVFPDGRIVFYYPPDERGIRGFRIKQSCELHPNGRSYAYLDADGRVLKSVSACDQPTGQRALYAVYPLHAGMLDSGAYAILTFFGGLALTLISATGAAAYIAKLKGAR